MPFTLVSQHHPTGDQPNAIRTLTSNIASGVSHQTLLGVTGSGKTFSMAHVIQQTQRPALIISPNKTLAAQLYQEFKELFPENGAHYFVSYYDYYQPEAYIPQTDTYIAKDAKINDVIDRLRHEAVQDLVSRKDVIVVASVSCIYSLGSPKEYQHVVLELTRGQYMPRKELLSHLTALQYERNDTDLTPGTFRARGEMVELYTVTGKQLLRVEFLGDQIASIRVAPASQDPIFQEASLFKIFPAKFWITPQQKLAIAISNIRSELRDRIQALEKQGKDLEAKRIEQRTNFDLEMIEESGYCHGIENYSRHMEFREPSTAPFTLLDYFPKDFLVFIDESHLTLPQIRAMSVQDRIRKESLVRHGFRLPSAIDNRPLTSDEFFSKAPQVIYVSATPGQEEKRRSTSHIAEQLVRPTGLVEPSVEIRSVEHEIQDLVSEIRKCVAKNERVLAVTITKQLAEDISDYLSREGIKVQWLHSNVKTMERPRILEQFRRGIFDVLVGINLLREGLDLPEVALVAILDADKEGFLRNETTLIQTMGRAARNPNGRVILYASKTSNSMTAALAEIDRRRTIQLAYNKEHHITPSAIRKEIREWAFTPKQPSEEAEFAFVDDISLLEQEMRKAAQDLDFERAAKIRDLIQEKKGGKVGAYADQTSSKKESAPKRRTTHAKHEVHEKGEGSHEARPKARGRKTG